MSFYAKHVFVCCNQRAPGKDCCANHGSEAMLGYLKTQVKARGLHGEGQVRVSRAGCLGRCEDGPLLVIYPQDTWYTFIDEADIDEIIERDLVQNQRVERLLK